jgi:hypothetical protein
MGLPDQGRMTLFLGLDASGTFNPPGEVILTCDQRESQTVCELLGFIPTGGVTLVERSACDDQLELTWSIAVPGDFNGFFIGHCGLPSLISKPRQG